MFRTSPVHLQERFVQAVFADLVCGNTRTRITTYQIYNLASGCIRFSEMYHVFLKVHAHYSIEIRFLRKFTQTDRLKVK